MKHVLLSPRQLEVARLASRGYTQVEIAEQLGISVRTVEHHAAIVRAKAGVTKTRAALRARARALAPRTTD